MAYRPRVRVQGGQKWRSDGTRTRGLRRDRPPNSLEKSVALPTFSIPEEKEIVAAVGTLKNKAAELGATLACNSPTCPEQGSASLYLQNSAVRVATDALSLGISLGLGGRRNVLFIPPDDIRPSSLALAGPSITFFSIDGGGRAGLPGINLWTGSIQEHAPPCHADSGALAASLSGSLELLWQWDSP